MSNEQEPIFAYEIPAGDNRPRRVCHHCGFIDYENPRIIVGSICAWEDRLLLCKRSIEPREGFWTLPAGFLESEETCEQGALREALEEARASIAIEALLGVYNLTRISQVHLFFRARLLSPEVAAGEETHAVQLVTPDQIPWGELAFPSVDWALQRYLEDPAGENPRPFFYPDLAAPPASVKP